MQSNMYILDENGKESTGLIGLLPRPDGIDALWHDLIAIMAAHPAWLTQVDTHENILERCKMGMYEAWIALSRNGAPEILGVCGWERHVRMSFYHVMYLGGTNLMAHFKNGLRELDRYVYMNGGSGIVLSGRKGWNRLLAKHGYAPERTLLVKNVVRSLGH